MAQLTQLREQRRQERIAQLRAAVQRLVAARPGWEVWLFGSWARGDWDARSDVDLLAVAPNRAEAEDLADSLLAARLADDAVPLDAAQWRQRQRGEDPYWRGICRDALRLDDPMAAER
jgi:uncharacterized protein